MVKLTSVVNVNFFFAELLLIAETGTEVSYFLSLISADQQIHRCNLFTISKIIKSHLNEPQNVKVTTEPLSMGDSNRISFR